MSFLLTCPHCGEREVTDFSFGGEVVPRPTAKPTERELNTYNYFRRNVAGVQREWWYHRSGLQGVVPGRARHHDERGQLGRAARRRPADDGGWRRAMTRLPPQPGERISRGRAIEFFFDGKKVEALEGDTIGSALHASGRKVLSRSFKYHRPRGLMCCAGQCPNCMVDVDGWPGVRACTEPVRPGMKVAHMNATPSLEFDAMRATDIFGTKFTPPGFYYKTFIRPRRLWPLYEKVLRGAAGLGKLRKSQAEREWRTEYRRRRADILVIGGGAAGMAAALRAAEMGADVVLADDGPELGGSLLAGEGAADAREAAERIRAAGVEVLAPAAALGFFDGIVPVWQGSTLHQVRADHHVAATGSIEQPLLFEGNDLPGVMLCSGAERLAHLYGVAPGDTALVATTADRGLASALALEEAGVEIAAIADARPEGSADSDLRARIDAAGIRMLDGATVVEAIGRKHVKGAVVADLDAAGRPDLDTRRGVDCDLIAVSGGTVPATSLLLQAGAKAAWDDASGAYLPQDLPADIHPAGAVAGHASTGLAAASGAVAGAEAALALELGGAADRERLEADRAVLDAGENGSSAGRPRPAPADGHKKCFACLCEDVTAKDISYAIDEGYDSLELLKRYTTLDHGALPGADVPARLDPPDRGAHGNRDRGRRVDHREAALVHGSDGRDGRPAVRAREALGDPRPPSRIGRQHHVGRGLAPRRTTTATPKPRRWPCTTAPA